MSYMSTSSMYDVRCGMSLKLVFFIGRCHFQLFRAPIASVSRVDVLARLSPRSSSTVSSPPVDPDAALFGTAQNIDGQALTIIGWSNVSTSFVFLLLRFLLRWRRNRCLLLDDYLIILGWLCLLALAIIQTEQVAGSMVCDRFTDFFVLGKCNSPSEVERARFSGYYAAAVDIATDLLIMGLPIAVLPGLQLDIRKKLGLAVAFNLALLTILTAVIRMTQVMKPDGLDMVGLSVWSITELGVSIAVGSLPPLRILFTSGFRRYIKGKKADHKCPAKGRDDNGNGYCPDTMSRSVIVTESIPLINKHDSEQVEGGIYVQKTYDVQVEEEGRINSSREEPSCE
ncbi:hypothetical protein CSUB01_01112 [Colletotrichum sublineola]|uniref:Rhodopsin domain-containing protein n=1 Tax=Colletotrichum sublineola TaxID=1173701 RepID=A0A066X4M7_COLSU|nr:hypothetical protein CSUB01_01112 [Colletotrichum sublineola]